MQKIKFKILTFFLVILILEIFFQSFYFFTVGNFYYSRLAIPIYNKDPYQCARLKNNLDYIHKTTEFSYRINTDENGYRISHNSSGNNVINSNKIIFLGPSFGFGYGVEYNKSYAFLISEYFKKNFSSINSSVPAIPIHMNLCWFLNNISNQGQTIVIQTIYGPGSPGVTNDFNKINCSKFCDTISVSKEGYLKVNDKFNFISFSTNTLKKSATIFYTWYFINNFFFSEKNELDSYEKINKQIGKSFYDHESEISKIKESYENYLSNIKMLNDKIKVYFIYIPPNFLISKKYYLRWAHKNIPLEKFKIKDKEFRNMMTNNFNFIDPTLELIKEEKKNQNYYLIDVHLTENGNRVIYKEAIRFIKKDIYKIKR